MTASGYRILARRLARDLARRIELCKRMENGGAVDAKVDDRQLAQCERTLVRFRTYESKQPRPSAQ